MLKSENYPIKTAETNHAALIQSGVLETQIHTGSQVLGTIRSLSQKANPYFPDILYWMTERGSTYIPLTDGRVIRHKQKMDRVQEPMSLVTFMPPISGVTNFLRQNNPTAYKKYFSEYDAQSVLLEYFNSIGNQRVRIIDSTGKTLKQQSDIAGAKFPILLGFIHKEGEKEIADFTIPVSITPTIGYSPFETGTNENNQYISHIGHPIVSIRHRNEL